MKPSKGLKAYPDGWQKVLNGAKDVVRGSVLVKEPFPSSHMARIAVNEAFHEVLASECTENGLVLEPGASPSTKFQTVSDIAQNTGFSWSESMVQIVGDRLFISISNRLTS